MTKDERLLDSYQKEEIKERKMPINIINNNNQPRKRKTDNLPGDENNLGMFEENYGSVKKSGIKEELITLYANDMPKSRKKMILRAKL